jgi:hypothetical protein
MEKYLPLMAILSIMALATVAGHNLVFAQEDKTQQCKSKQADMFSKMNQWLSKRQTPAGQLDQDGSLKASLVSLSNEMTQITQITQDCRSVIDLSQPPAGYTKEDMDKLKSSVFTELCKMENCST